MTPKILGLDVETMPGLATIWRLGKQYVGVEQLQRPTRCVMAGAKWFGDPRSLLIVDERGRGGNYGMMKKVHALVSRADVVVGYNSDGFDLPWLRGAMVEHGLPPLPPVTSIDLYKAVKKFRFMSNKLAYVAPLLKIGQKVKTEGLDLWLKCLAGDRAAWGRMRTYNAQDVRLLETGYFRLLPYISNHPRLHAAGKDRPTCGTCGADSIQYRGVYRTKTMTYDRGQCQKCGTWDNKLNGRRT